MSHTYQKQIEKLSFIFLHFYKVFLSREVLDIFCIYLRSQAAKKFEI